MCKCHVLNTVLGCLQQVDTNVRAANNTVLAKPFIAPLEWTAIHAFPYCQVLNAFERGKTYEYFLYSMLPGQR